MAEDIVKDVGFLNVIEGFARADKVAGRKAPVGQMPEEHVIGDQHGHRHHAPACERVQLFRHRAELGNAAFAKVKLFQPRHKRARRAAGQQLRLARKQIVPDGVILARIVRLRGLDPILTHMARALLRAR